MATKWISPTWRMPENSNQNKLDNYSLNFAWPASGGTRLNISSSSLLDNVPLNPYSFSFWFKSTSNSSVLSEKRAVNSFTNAQYTIHISGGKIVWYGGQGSNTSTATSTALNDGQWHHIVCVAESTTVSKIYVDGQLDVTSSTNRINQTLVTGNFYIGSNYLANNYYFSGQLSQYSIFDYPLSLTQVKYLYNNNDTVNPTVANPQNPMSIPGKSPIAYYDLGGSSTGDAAAASPNTLTVPNSSVPSATVFNFDGIDDYIELASSSTAITDWTQPYTISMWVNYTSIPPYGLIATFGIETGDTSTTRYIMIGGHLDYLFTGVGNKDNPGMTTIHFNIGSNLNDGNWHNIVYVGNGTSGDFPTVYVDGVLEAYSGGTTALYNSSTYLNVIGTGSNATGRYFPGKISNVQVFNTALPATGSNSVETIYNNGTPLTSMSGFTSLKAWWKLNVDTSTWGGSNWSITDSSGEGNTGTSSGMNTANLVTSDLTRSIPYSSYSMNFDGNNYINSSFSGNVYACSLWFKPSSVINAGDAAQYLISFGGTWDGVVLGEMTSHLTNELILITDSSITGRSAYTASGGSISADWHHLCLNWTGSVYEIWLDGTNVQNATTGTPTLINASALQIGRRSTSNYYYFDGKISNVAVFSSTLTEDQVQKIHNGSIPNDISSLSPVGWWSLSGDSYYNGTDWICPDLGSGGNNGNSDGTMGGDELVGDGPGSEANGVATNMNVISNLRGNAPNSNANAFSINMSFENKTNDTP